MASVDLLRPLWLLPEATTRRAVDYYIQQTYWSTLVAEIEGIPRSANHTQHSYAPGSFDGTPVLLASSSPESYTFYADLSNRTRIVNIDDEDNALLELPRKQFAAYFIPIILEVIEEANP